MYKRMNPWAGTMLGQPPFCEWSIGFALKRCDPQRWVIPGAADGAPQPRRQPRLNPLEFHGRRRPSAMAQRAKPATKRSAE